MSKFEYFREDRYEEEKTTRKLPEFIYVEEQGEWRQEGPFEYVKAHFSHSAERMKELRYPLALRLFCLIGSFCLFTFVFFALICLAFSLLVNIVTLFRMRRFWHTTKNLWEATKRIFVTSCGLFVAVFSPSFGLAIVMVYFLLLGEDMEEQWASRILKSRLSRFW